MRSLVALLILFGCAYKTDFSDGKSLVGVRYQNSPLGEGVAPDADPLMRFDAFDCTTFVETVLADGDVKKLNKIRYKNGKVDFINRNHFIETDWLKNNSDIVENVSHKFGKTDIRTVVIDKKSWFKTVHNIDVEFVPETVNLEYIPYENIGDLELNKTYVVLFVADNPKIRDKIGTDIAVVHMGLLLPNGVLRHASSEHGKVVDVDFKDYVLQRQRNKTNIGIVILEIK